jgi:hypothetical protein
VCGGYEEKAARSSCCGCLRKISALSCDETLLSAATQAENILRNQEHNQ